MEVEMDVSAVHHHHHHHHNQQQDMGSQTLESMLACNKAQQDKKPRPPEEALKCPRCDSSNTKFCYYNNYSLTQPRYFCKSCRRYWTKGGTLRNVPVGGGCRKNKRSSSSSSSATSSNSSTSSALSKIRNPQEHHLIQQHHHQQQLNMMNSNSNNHLISGLPHLPYDSTCTDLSLAFARLQSQANGHMGYDHFDPNDPNSNHSLASQGNNLGFLDAIRGGFLENGTTTPTPNGFHNNNMLYNGGNIGNVNLMGLNNGGGGSSISISNHDQEDQELLNRQMYEDDNQEVPPLIHHNSNSNCGAVTTAVTMAAVKQEASNMMRSSDHQMGMGMGDNRSGVLWGIPWQMGAGGAGGGTGGIDQGNMMIHEVESGGRSQIGGWNGIGSTWHGLINSPLM